MSCECIWIKGLLGVICVSNDSLFPLNWGNTRKCATQITMIWSSILAISVILLLFINKPLISTSVNDSLWCEINLWQNNLFTNSHFIVLKISTNFTTAIFKSSFLPFKCSCFVCCVLAFLVWYFLWQYWHWYRIFETIHFLVWYLISFESLLV